MLSNKTAFITGASKNLGRAIAIDLAKQGVTVVINYLNSETEAKETFKEIEKYSKGLLIQGDVTNEEDVTSIYRMIEMKFGGVDILINLVGNFIFEPITTTSFGKFKDVIESNLYHSFLCTQQAIPHMQKKQWGRVINFGCAGADRITIRKNTTPYYIAKTGVIMLSKVLAAEYAKDHITINSVSPGILETSVAKPPTPSGRNAQFSDIINAINMLLKDESEYINGANIEVSGGLVLGFT